MPKQDFKAIALLTEEQKAGTLFRRGSLGRQGGPRSLQGMHPQAKKPSCSDGPCAPLRT